MSRSSYGIIIVGVLFFIFGFVTWLNGSLIPYLKELCDLSDFEALFVTFSFYIAYSVMALPMSYLLDRLGYKRGMALGLVVMSVGSLLFIPSALSGEYLLFLLALFVLATGLTILQSASNPYIVYLGDIASATRRISIMGIINKLAGVLAPMLFALLVTIDSDDKTAMASDLIAPYAGMAVVLASLVLLVRLLPAIEHEVSGVNARSKSVLDHPHAILGAVALFFYVGIEVIAGDTIGLYAQSLGEENFSVFTSYTMLAMVVGYLFGIVLTPRYIDASRALALFSLLGVVLTFAIITLSPNAYLVALLGLSNAIVWPAIWQLSLGGVGDLAKRVSALLIIAIAGGAILPLIYGKLSQIVGMQSSYSLGLICYTIILLYAIKWHKARSWSEVW